MQRWADVIRLRLRSLFRRGKVDGELERELRFHLDNRVRELEAEGHRPQEARDRAQREFGSVASISEQCRDTRRVNVVSNILQDLRYGARTLHAQPMLVAAATTSIALGVGVNLMIFGLANSVLLSKPTARAVDELVHVRTGNGSHVSYPAWREFAAADVVAGIAGYRMEIDAIWRQGERSTTLTPLIVTANYFDVLGVPVAIGRAFGAAEAAAERDPRVAVLTDRFWRAQLGADPAIVGRTITINGQPYTVLGITPPRLRSLPGFGIVPDAFIPFSRGLAPSLDRPRESHVQLVARLRPDQPVAEAQAALATVATRISAAFDDEELGIIREVAYVGGLSQMREFKGLALIAGVLLIVTNLVLAIACANVAGLLLARGTARRREIALRLAIGASRGRLVQQLLTEGFLLSLLGAAAGIAVTALLARTIGGVAAGLELPIEPQLLFDNRLTWFAVTLVVLSTLLCALAPALQATRASLAPALKHEPIAFVHRRFNLRAMLVTGQVTVSVLLLVITMLFLRNLSLASQLSPGFDAERLILAQVNFVEGRQGAAAAPSAVRLADRLRAIAGVERVSLSQGVPLTARYGGETGTNVRIDGIEEPVRVRYHENRIGPEYFETMGIPIVRGRGFLPSDGGDGQRIAIVNESFVRRYMGSGEPTGRHVFLPVRTEYFPTLIVGVVGDSKYRSIGEDHEPAVYTPVLRGTPPRFVNVLIRTTLPPEPLIKAVGDEILRFDATAGVSAEPMTAALTFAFLPSRIGAAIMGALGLLGALLAMVGLYGVVSFAVSRRTSEIGIRIALGASRRAIMGLVLREGGALVATGVVAGLLIAVVATGPLRAFLVADLPVHDPISFAATVALLAITSLAAIWGPARRAMRIEPAVSLRVE